jgi:hypothetical protein
MRGLIKSVAAVALLVVSLQPLASCFSPEMTTSEDECCQQMMGDCGRVSMPSSHSCCTYVDSSAIARLEARKAMVIADLAAVLAEAPDVPSLAAPMFHTAEVTPESPPHSPPLSIQILRI